MAAEVDAAYKPDAACEKGHNGAIFVPASRIGYDTPPTCGVRCRLSLRVRPYRKSVHNLFGYDTGNDVLDAVSAARIGSD